MGNIQWGPVYSGIATVAEKVNQEPQKLASKAMV